MSSCIHYCIPQLFENSHQTLRFNRSYFQVLHSNESKLRYVEILSRLIVFVTFSLQRRWDLRLEPSKISILKNILFDDEEDVLETTSVQHLEIEDIAEILRILFCRKFGLREGRWEDTVYIFWSHLGLEANGVFKGARDLTTPIAALQYAMRLTVLYLVVEATDDTQ